MIAKGAESLGDGLRLSNLRPFRSDGYHVCARLEPHASTGTSLSCATQPHIDARSDRNCPCCQEIEQERALGIPRAYTTGCSWLLRTRVSMKSPQLIRPELRTRRQERNKDALTKLQKGDLRPSGERASLGEELWLRRAYSSR